ncbi:MAG: protein TolQ [Coxiellaceae bacterium]|nr:MAG: protein TolQ [Coxiellaceae bacterium]
MTTAPTLWGFISHAGPVVRTVMVLLLLASVASWTMIFQRIFTFKQANRNLREFENRFWSGADLSKLQAELEHKPAQIEGIASIFNAGFKEFTRLNQQAHNNPEAIMEGCQRAMRVAHSREVEKLEQHLNFLATVGSTSPYVGLFGTVWGIMTSFQALGAVQQATIAMVAPGISEALIATAMGLFAAIPAVIAYNRFSADVERLTNNYDTFQEEFASILHRETHTR